LHLMRAHATELEAEAKEAKQSLADLESEHSRAKARNSEQ